MAYRQEEKVELGIWPIFAFLTNPAFWAGVGKVATTAASAYVTSSLSAAPPGAGGVARPESSIGPFFTQQVDVQKRLDEILAKGKVKEEELIAEERAKKMAMLQPTLWGVLIIVGGIAIWKTVKRKKAK